MKKKTFDAVEMKRKGAMDVYERIKAMTSEQEAEYWRGRNMEFQREQKKIRRSKSSKNAGDANNASRMRRNRKAAV